MARISVETGRGVRGEVSRRRSCPISRSSVGVIKESKQREPNGDGYS